MSTNELPPKNLETTEEAARSLIKNSTAFLIGDTITKILSFIFNVYVVRQLGGERFGFYSTALAYTGIFSIIGDLGMTQYAIREIARGRQKIDNMFWDLVAIRLILSVVATIFTTASAAFVAGYDNSMVLGIFIACIGFFFHAFFGPIEIILRGHERIDYLSVLNTLTQASFILAGTVVLLSGYTFHSLIVASYIGVPFLTLLGVYFVKRLNLATLKIQINPQTWLPILKHSLPFALITFTLMAAQDLDTVLLSLWRSPEEVGWYKAAYNLIFKLLFIRNAIMPALMPQMSRYYGTSKERVGQTFNFAFKFLWAISLPIAIGTSIMAKPLTIFLYTEEFSQSAIALAILIWSVPLLNLSSLCGGMTTATDKENKAVRVYTLAAILNLTTNLIAIPIWGYVGSAVATVLTETITLVFFYRILHDEFPLKDLRNSLLKPLIAGGIMGGVVMMLQNLPLAIVVAIGMIVYTVILLALKPFTSGEQKIFGNLLLTMRNRISGKPNVS